MASHLLLRVIRRYLRIIDAQLAGKQEIRAAQATNSCVDHDEALKFLLTLKVGEGTAYLHQHLDRIARTLTLVPRPCRSRRVLELGAYMHMTPALKLLCGFDPAGAYLGPKGKKIRKDIVVGDRSFSCNVDMFDAERDVYPYQDCFFEGVLACEIIEHLVCDPMWMLMEIRRVLAPDGWLLVTTPNCVSLSSIQRALIGRWNPQVFAQYDRRFVGERPHVREYTPHELFLLLRMAGFGIETRFTDRTSAANSTWVIPLLAQLGFDTELRGEQIYCLARKQDNSDVERYPAFLYAN